MTAVYGVFAALLMALLAGGLLRVFRGPTQGDRMIAAQLVATGTVAVLLVVARLTGIELVRDVALVFVVLGALSTLAFVRLAPPGPPAGTEPPGPRPDGADAAPPGSGPKGGVT